MKLINKNNMNPQVGLLRFNEHRMEEKDMITLHYQVIQDD